jgi:large subunit ribosomal protein L20
MPRVKRGFKARRRRSKLLLACRGYRGARSRTYRVAKETFLRAGNFAFRDRKGRRREFRALWIARINAAARIHGVKYSTLMNWLNKAQVQLDRRVLADMAAREPASFAKLISSVKPASR